MALNLLQRIDHHTHKDEQRRTTEELGKCLLHIEQTSQRRHHGDEGDEERTGQRDTRHDGVDIVCGVLSGLDAGNETIVALHVFCHLCRVHRDGGLEIREEDDEDDIDDVVQQAAVVKQ